MFVKLMDYDLYVKNTERICEDEKGFLEEAMELLK
jgi:hypothetical protein